MSEFVESDLATPSQNASPTQSLDRAMALLDVVVSRAIQGASLGELAIATGLTKATAHRLLMGLRNAGMVDYQTSARLYFPAFKLFRMGQAAGARFAIIRVAHPSLVRLAEATGDTVYLTVRNGDYVICVAREQGEFPIKILTLDIGDARPLGLGSNGIIQLAAMSDEECERVLTRNQSELAAHENFDVISVRNYVARARENGYALNEGYMLPEMAAVAVGIRDPNGAVIASISVAAITSRLQPPRRDSIVQQLRSEIQQIEHQLASNII